MPTERGIQPGSSRDHHQARASSFICGAGTVAPGSLVRGEPALEVLLRPEEDHRASREADVVPPPARGHENVAQEVGAPDELAVAYDEFEISQHAHSVATSPSACSAPGIPSASQQQRPGPRAATGTNAMGRRREAERIRHPDVVRARVHERMRVVETPIRGRSRLGSSANGDAPLSSAVVVRHDGEVDVPANVEVDRVHQCLKWRRPVKTIAAPASTSRKDLRRRASSHRAG